MECPQCRLENPPGAYVCDCGYRFQARPAPAKNSHASQYPSHFGPGRILFNRIASVVIPLFLAVGASLMFLFPQDQPKTEAAPAPPARPKRQILTGSTFELLESEYCLPTKADLQEVQKWMGLGDVQEATLQLLRANGVMASPGEKAKLLERELLGDIRVRLLKSRRECWMPSEAAE